MFYFLCKFKIQLLGFFLPTAFISSKYNAQHQLRQLSMTGLMSIHNGLIFFQIPGPHRVYALLANVYCWYHYCLQALIVYVLTTYLISCISWTIRKYWTNCCNFLTCSKSGVTPANALFDSLIRSASFLPNSCSFAIWKSILSQVCCWHSMADLKLETLSGSS